MDPASLAGDTSECGRENMSSQWSHSVKLLLKKHMLYFI